MKAVLNLLLMGCLLFPTINVNAQKNIIFYYDYYFNKTSQKNASYFSLESIDSLGNYKVEFYNQFNDQLHSIKTYKSKRMDVLNGKYEVYQPNKKLLESGFYSNDEKFGTWNYYHENGRLKMIQTYDDEGKLEGPFVKFYNNGDTLEVGQYQDGSPYGNWLTKHENGNLKKEQFFLEGGNKTGFWKEFYDNNSLMSEGEYLNDSLHGIWKWYHPNGQPSSIEEYNNGALVQFQFYNDTGVKQNYSELPYIVPEFPGGLNKLLEFIGKNINYPPIAQEQGIQGRVVLRLEISPSGKIVNVEILKDIGGGCGEETVRMVNKMPNWTKGVNHNLPINFYHVLPVKFTLQ
jgi:TonB family protein